MSLSPKRPTHPLSSTQSPRRLTTATTAAAATTTTTTTSVTGASSAGVRKDRPRQTHQTHSGTGNPYAMQLQKETEALLRQTNNAVMTPATQLRTFSCGSVCHIISALCIALNDRTAGFTHQTAFTVHL